MSLPTTLGLSRFRYLVSIHFVIQPKPLLGFDGFDMGFALLNPAPQPNLIELIHNGKIAQAKEYPEGTYSGEWEFDLSVETDGRLSGRASGNARDSFDHAVYAHTSPIYIGSGKPAGVS